MITVQAVPRRSNQSTGKDSWFVPIENIDFWWLKEGRVGFTADREEYYVDEPGWTDDMSAADAQAQIEALRAYDEGFEPEPEPAPEPEPEPEPAVEVDVKV